MDEFKPGAVPRAVERYGVTTTAVVPTMLHRVLGARPGGALDATTRDRYARSSRVGAPLPGAARARG